MKSIVTNCLTVLTVLFALSAMTLATACAQGEKGSGKVVKEERKLSTFNELDVSGIMEIVLVQGNKEMAVVEADDNLMEHIKTEVNGKKLKVYTDGIKDANELKVTVYLKEIKRLEISGAVSVRTEGNLSSSNLELDCSGAAKIKADLEATVLEGDISGGTKLNLSGNVEKMEMDISGAASLDGFELKTKVCEFDVSGAAKVEVSCSERLEADVTGSAKIVYKGDPSVEESVSGVASISRYNSK